jgi:hypothetical protein
VIEEELFGRAFAPVILMGPALRGVWGALYGGSRESKVLNALLADGPLTLSALATRCGASERSVRRPSLPGGEREGWLRAVVERYRDAGIVTERRGGCMIVLQLNEMSPAVALLRAIRLVPEAPPGT